MAYRPCCGIGIGDANVGMKVNWPPALAVTVTEPSGAPLSSGYAGEPVTGRIVAVICVLAVQDVRPLSWRPDRSNGVLDVKTCAIRRDDGSDTLPLPPCWNTFWSAAWMRSVNWCESVCGGTLWSVTVAVTVKVPACSSGCELSKQPLVCRLVPSGRAPVSDQLGEPDMLVAFRQVKYIDVTMPSLSEVVVIVSGLFT